MSKYPTFNNPHDALSAVGLDPGIYAGLNLIPYKIERVGTAEKPRGKDGFVIPFEGGNFLCGNWNGEQRAVYCKGGENHSKEELQEFHKEAEKAYQMVLRAKELEYSAMAEKAKIFWATCDSYNQGNIHPYFAGKLLEPVPTIKETTNERFKQSFGYFVKEKDRETPATGRILVVPMEYNGTLASLQLITETGAKTFLGGAKSKNCYWLAERPKNQSYEYIAIAEGVATLLAVMQHYTFCLDGVVVPKEKVIAVACMTANNLAGVAQTFRAKYPDATIVIFGDNDKSGTGQRKARDAQLSIDGKTGLQIPEFSDREKRLFKTITGKKAPSDWADKYLINHHVKETENGRNQK